VASEWSGTLEGAMQLIRRNWAAEVLTIFELATISSKIRNLSKG
jgi:hypothetical protein